MDAAQKKLVEKNVALAQFLARTVWARNREQMDIDEVVSIAYQGLVSAALKYDPHVFGMSQETIDNGKAFSGFARRKILGAILDWQRSLDHVQRSYRFDYRAIVRAGFIGQLGQGVSLAVLSERTGLSKERIQTVLLAVLRPPISTEEVIQEIGDEPVAISAEDTAMASSIKRSVHQALLGLSPLAQVIIAKRYYQQMELQAIAQELELDLTLVRTMHSEAVLVLHEAMRKRVDDRSGPEPRQRRTA